ncbi:MAG: ABC transporter permease [Micromonosporaceae bacterium]|nr:ABC transporter permease [Micromonosporaceae bacterium]
MSRVADSVIHDLGYQRYSGPRLGRRYAIRSLYWHSLRGAFGLGRGFKAKIFPWSLIAIFMLVAILVITGVALAGERLMSYAQFNDTLSVLTVLFVASVASEIISKDLGPGVLSLYFARPLRRGDYVAAKFAAVVSAIMLLLGVPQLLMFAGISFALDDGIQGVGREAGKLVAGLAHASIHAAVIGSIGALAASLCRRRVFAAIAVVGAFLVPTPIAGILSISQGALGQLSSLASPLNALARLQLALFSHSTDADSYVWCYIVGVVAMAVCATVGLLLRYRRVEA